MLAPALVLCLGERAVGVVAMGECGSRFYESVESVRIPLMNSGQKGAVLTVISSLNQTRSPSGASYLLRTSQCA